ncbi:MAG: cyclodeaminase/cyclohydrolase family protein [Planctomycetota bacterium]
MKYIDDPLRKYFDEAASASETPGGGSIAGVCGALAAAMMSMVCNFTIGRKKYAAVEPEARELLAAAGSRMEEMLRLAVADTEGFDVIAKAYALPKETEADKAARSTAIEAGCRAAMDAPARIFDGTLAILRTLRRLVEIGNRNLISDVGVSAIMARAAAEAAAMNVMINLKAIKDEPFTSARRAALDAGLREADAIEREVKAKVWAAVR